MERAENPTKSRQNKKLELMNFTVEQKVAITKMAMAMAEADGKVETREGVLIALQTSSWKLVESVFDAAGALSADAAMSILSSMTLEQKKYVCGYLACISIVDGSCSEKESVLWKLVCTLANFPLMKFGDALEFYKNNQQ